MPPATPEPPHPAMQAVVRPAAASDAVAVAQVLCASRRAFLPFAPMVHPDAEVQRWVARVLIPTGGVQVADAGGRIVAVLAMSSDSTGGWIDQLYVRPGCTGHGLGLRLLALAHGRLHPPVRLFTFQANTGARRFYERQGYRVLSMSDGAGNEERCPDVLYAWSGPATSAAPLRFTVSGPGTAYRIDADTLRATAVDPAAMQAAARALLHTARTEAAPGPAARDRSLAAFMLATAGAAGEAEHLLRQVLPAQASGPARPVSVSRLRLSQALLALGRAEDAADVAAEALRQVRADPSQADLLDTVLHHLGKAWLEAGRIDPAIDVLAQALGLRQRQPDADLLRSTQMALDLALRRSQARLPPRTAPDVRPLNPPRR